MKRRSKIIRNGDQARRPKASKPKRAPTPEKVSKPSSPHDREKGEIERLTRELDEARGQQAATSEVLQVISRSPSDLEPVFATMLEKAVRICDATFGNIFRWDGEAFQLMAAHKTPPALAKARKLSPIRPAPTTLFGRLVATKSLVHTPDLAAEQQYAPPCLCRSCPTGGHTNVSCCPDVEGRRTNRCVRPVPPRSSTLYR
jgi:hypothetical protein